METMRVKAVEGRMILMPSRGMKPVPATPTVVPRDTYYQTAVLHGDLEEVADEPEAAQIDESETLKQATEKGTQAGPSDTPPAKGEQPKAAPASSAPVKDDPAPAKTA